jgi:hypothetical protein
MLVLKHQQMQGVADTAAYSAAVAKAAGSASVTTQARAIASSQGFTDGSGGISVTVNQPPSAGLFAGNSSYIEVVIAQPQPSIFSKIFGFGSFNVSSRAVAHVGASSSSGSGCVLALASNNGSTTDHSLSGAVTIANGGSLNLSGCDLYDNSTATGSANPWPGTGALVMASTQINQASGTTSSVNIVGDILLSGGGTGLNVTNVNVGGSVVQVSGAPVGSGSVHSGGVSPTSDPYAASLGKTSGAWTPPSGSCTTPSTNSWSATTINLSPGLYCNIVVGQSNRVNLAAGTYYIDSGDFNIGSGTVTGSGVTIVLTSSHGSYGNLLVANGATLSLTAPTSGTFSGIAVAQNPNAPFQADTLNTCSSASNAPSGQKVNSFAGGSTSSITGALYFPAQSLCFSNNGQVSASSCTQAIANKIYITGSAGLAASCANAGTKSIGSGAAVATALVE